MNITPFSLFSKIGSKLLEKKNYFESLDDRLDWRILVVYLFNG